MKENELFEIIGDIDDEKIKRAYNAKNPKSRFILLRRVSMVACFILIAALSFSIIDEKAKENIPQKEASTLTERGSTSDNTYEKKEQLEINSDGATSPQEETNIEMRNEEVKTESSEKEEIGKKENDEIIEEATMDASPEYFSGGGGGSSGGSSDNSALRKEEFSLDYLNSLSGKIIEQATNEDLSFIVSSCVNESTNRVEVLVTSMEKELIDRIKMLDTQGGAIEFKLSSDNMDLN